MYLFVFIAFLLQCFKPPAPAVKVVKEGEKQKPH